MRRAAAYQSAAAYINLAPQCRWADGTIRGLYGLVLGEVKQTRRAAMGPYPQRPRVDRLGAPRMPGGTGLTDTALARIMIVHYYQLVADTASSFRGCCRRRTRPFGQHVSWKLGTMPDGANPNLAPTAMSTKEKRRRNSTPVSLALPRTPQREMVRGAQSTCTIAMRVVRSREQRNAKY